MEKIIEVLTYTMIFIFVHELNAVSYLKENNLENIEYNKNVHSNIVDIINVIMSISISIAYLITSYKTKDNRLYGIDEMGIKVALVHIALFIYEIFYNKIDEKNVAMFIHHTLIIGIFSYSIYRQFLQFYISTGGIVEITNVFLKPLTLFKRNEIFLDKLVYPGIGLFLSFIFARLILLPYVYYILLHDSDYEKQEDIVHYNVGKCIILVIFLLSCYWFMKITRILLKEGKKIFK